MRSKHILGDSGLVNCTCDITDKVEAQEYHVMTMLDRTNQMFEYEGLPDTIPAQYLELFLQMRGHIAITKVKGKLYALTGNFGGAPDPYYRPTLYVVANPALEYSASLKVLNFLEPAMKQDSQGECVVIRNDTNCNGMLPMFRRYAAQMTENEISIRSAQINSRQQTFIAAQTDAEAASAKAYLDGVEAGKIVAVASAPFLDGISAVNVAAQSSNSIIQLIELQQYLKASWFNDIGLNANFNMKREYMSTEELQQSTDVLLPLIDDMLRCREDAIDIINSTYGTNIKVKKNSAWENKQTTVSSAVMQQVAEAMGAKAEAEAAGEEVDTPDPQPEVEEKEQPEMTPDEKSGDPEKKQEENNE